MGLGGGTNSCSSPRRFGCREADPKLSPVILPPGRLTLVTRPLSIGSPPLTNTIGMVEVAAWTARMVCIWADDHGHLPLRQIRRECRQPIELVLRPAKFDRDVVAVDEPGFLQAVAECRYPVNVIGSRGGIEETDHRYRRSLRARRERPRGCRAAEQRDELAPFYLTELHLTLDEPGLRRKYIQLMRFSQEVAERFYTD